MPVTYLVPEDLFHSFSLWGFHHTAGKLDHPLRRRVQEFLDKVYNSRVLRTGAGCYGIMDRLVQIGVVVRGQSVHAPWNAVSDVIFGGILQPDLCKRSGKIVSQ